MCCRQCGEQDVELRGGRCEACIEDDPQGDGSDGESFARRLEAGARMQAMSGDDRGEDFEGLSIVGPDWVITAEMTDGF